MNYIVLESVPDCSDNTKAVFDEMVRRKVNQKYKLVWLIQNPNHKIKGIRNVRCVLTKNPFKNWYIFNAKCLISCNQKIQTSRNGQYSLYLGHGMPIKALRQAAPKTPETITNWLAMSEKMAEVFSYEFNMPIESGVLLGYPRNDEFYKTRVDLHKIFSVEFNKAIVWYPTFRQNHGGISASDSNIALPIIHDPQKAIELNDFAERHKLLIVLKPHFAQDIQCLLDLKLPYIRFINDEFLFKNKLSSYQLVNACDALLTDYSSVYFDFLLSNRPIGLTWEDYGEYAKRPGFAIDMEQYMVGGEKIYTLGDLKLFLRKVSCDVDDLKGQRNEVLAEVHKHRDGQSAERVVEHILHSLDR